MKKIYLLLCLTVLLGGLQGCATIVKGSKQQVTITSNPSQANIYINGRLYGKTPSLARLDRKDNQFIKIELEGYHPFETHLQRKFNGWIFGNIIFGGIIGIIVDASTGAMYSLTPNQVTAQLSGTIQTNILKQNDGIYLGVVLNADPSWTKIGTLEKQ
jgi:hypothetical protein